MPRIKVESQQCTGTSKSTGERCIKRVIGGTVCRYHGQNKRTKAAMARRIAEARAQRVAERWGVPVEVTGVEAIIQMIHLWAGIERFYRQRVESLSDEQMIWGTAKAMTGYTGDLDAASTTQEAKPHLWVVMHERASLNLVKIASEAVRAGVEERRIRLAEQQGALVAEVLQRIFVDLDLSERQWTRISEVVPRHLRMLGSSEGK